MRKGLSTVVFWGAAWGLAEATIGFVLHKAAVALPGLPGFLMFPIAVFFMHRAYKSSERAEDSFFAACVAASVKLVDFLVPGHDPIRIINPAISLLMEGLAVYAVLIAFGNLKRQNALAASFVMGAIWRAMFLVHLRITSLFGLPAGLVTGPIHISLRFLLLESAVNAAVIGLAFAVSPKKSRFWSFTPGLSSALAVLLVAAVFQYML